MANLLRGLLKLALWLGAVALVIAAVLKIFFVDILYVGHNGMAPTMVRGERVLVWRGAEPKFGRVMLCKLPSSGEHVVGRVVGTGGRDVGSSRGSLTIGGTMPPVDWKEKVEFFDEDTGRTEQYSLGIEDLSVLAHPILEKEIGSFRIRARAVAAGRVYLLGDNRSHIGQDSRSFGDVPAETCLGSIFMRLTPTDQSREKFDHRYVQLID
jgi:signal peptidase I